MKKIRGIIIDDESKSRTLLASLCEKFCDNLCLVGSAASVKEALLMIEEEQPDLIFLDIQMPVHSGFDLLRHYEDLIPFEVIFTTAYDQYALKAFEFVAADYLLKPINVDELIASVNRVAARIQKGQTPSHLQLLKKNLNDKNFNKLAISTGEGFIFIKISDIIRCEADSNYAAIYTAGGQRYLVTKTLKHYENILSDHSFFRIHKSHLINLSYVRRFVKGRPGLVELQDGTKVEVSLRKREHLLAQLNKFKQA